MKHKPHPFTKEQFIEKSRKRYGDKYDYSQVQDISTRYDTATVVCPEHGSFEVVAIDHYTGKRECPICRPVRQYRKLKENRVTKRTRENFIEEAKALFGDRYDYSHVPSENIKGMTKVPIICPDHGEFYQAIHLHLQGSGCPVCARDRVSKQKMVSQTEFIARAYLAHGDYYDLSEAVYTGSEGKVKVICPSHGEFWINARNFTDGQGCRQCYLDERERQAKNSRRARRLYFERKQELKEVFAGVNSEKK
jgi:ssDNA-binding Zn-finger/Zn-ribbon topoisomerase 1